VDCLLIPLEGGPAVTLEAGDLRIWVGSTMTAMTAMRDPRRGQAITSSSWTGSAEKADERAVPASRSSPFRQFYGLSP
jgi:hypothetical protein